MNLLKNSLLVIVTALLAIPFLEQQTTLVPERPLKGYFGTAAMPVFSEKTWISGDFQQAVSGYLNERFGFRSTLVRICNQVDFSLFRQVHAKKIICGKEGYLFGQQYIEAWQGSDFAGTPYVRAKVEQLKALQDMLWRDHHILLVVVLAPDKGTYYTEYIPVRFSKKKLPATNYRSYSEALLKSRVNLIDFNELFRSAKDTSRYSLYPKTGIHWSHYGALVAADSLRSYLSERLQTRLPEIVVDCVEISREPRGKDNDIEQTLNLILPVSSPPLAYPVFHIDSGTGTTKPSALFIGDSFYWNWYDLGLIDALFSGNPFWYYDKDIYPESHTKPMNTSQVDLLQEVFRQDVIILLQTNAGYGDIGFGFADRLYASLNPGHSRVRYFEEQIRNSKEWLEMIRQKAIERNIPLDEMIRLDAIYMVNQELLNLKQKPAG